MKKTAAIILLVIPFVLHAQQVKFFNTFGNGIYDSGEGVLQAADTGYVVAGITTPTGSNGTDGLLYKTDSLGNLLWWKKYGGNGVQGFKGIKQAIGGSGYVLAGYSNSLDTSGYNVYLTKTNLNGDTLWTRTYGGADWEMAYAIDTLADSCYIVAGETYSFGNGNLDMYLLKIRMNGDTVWTRALGGTEDDYARYVHTDRNGNILAVGSTNSFGAGGSDLYIVYLNPDGDTLWTRTYGSSYDEYGYSADMYIDNGNKMSFAIGFTSYNPVQDAQESHILRMDSINTLIYYDVSILLTNPEILDHIRLRRAEKGRFYYTGDVKYTSDGSTDIYLHHTLYGIGFNTSDAFVSLPANDWPRDIRRCYDMGYIITGETQSYGPGTSATFVLKTDSMFGHLTTVTVGIDEEPSLEFTVYPNPVTDGYLFIQTSQQPDEINIYNMNGQMVTSQKIQGEMSVQIILPELPQGMYIAEVRSGAYSGRKKIIISH